MESTAEIDLLAELEDEEQVEAIVLGEWSEGMGVDDGPQIGKLPPELAYKPLSLDEARPYLQGWEVEQGFGLWRGYHILVWTDSRVLFVHEYDGSGRFRSVPRNPPIATEVN